MRIAVDGRHLAAGRGVARYTRSLLGALATQFPGEDWRVFVPGAQPVDSPVVATRHRAGSRALFAAAALTGRPRLDRLAGGADVVWAPAPAPLAVSRDVPLVLTVHDLSWELRPQDFTAYELLWHRLARIRALAAGADRVITDAKATADELVARWSVPAEKVVVIPLGPGLGGVAHVDPVYPGQRASPLYFLAVGALEPRKAPDLLARAHARARKSGLKAELVFAGDGRLAAEVQGPGVRVLGRQDDAALRVLYAGALAVVQPSYLEGFAFPPIEGLAHGIPAVVSDLPVYDETVGTGALRMPAGDEEALAAALLRIEREPDLRAQLVADGRTAIARLSWERAARETHAVLAEVARR